jgi:hypothetical protein
MLSTKLRLFPDHRGGAASSAGDEARGERGAGKEESNVTNATASERADLVDVFYAPFVRPLGNLVILAAQVEATWLKLVATLTGCTEKEAQSFLQIPGAKAKQKIMPLAQTFAIESYELRELSKGIENFYGDRERRNRLIHDDWYVSLLKAPGMPATRGVRRKDGAVVFGDSMPDDVWNLASRFREYESLFSHVVYVLQKQKGAESVPDDLPEEC